MEENEKENKQTAGPLGQNPEKLPKPGDNYNPEFIEGKSFTTEHRPVNPQEAAFNEEGKMEEKQKNRNMEDNREAGEREEDNGMVY